MLTPSTRRLATWSNSRRLQRRPRYAVPVFVLSVPPHTVQRYRRRRPDFVANQPWPTMLRPGFPKLSHPGFLLGREAGFELPERARVVLHSLNHYRLGLLESRTYPHGAKSGSHPDGPQLVIVARASQAWVQQSAGICPKSSRDGFARDCPLRHPVTRVLALRDRSGAHRRFLVVCGAISAASGGDPTETRGVRDEAARWVAEIVSRAAFGGPDLRDARRGRPARHLRGA